MTSRIPPHAVSLWFEGDRLCVAFSENSHLVTIPIDRAEVNCNDFGTPLPNQRGWNVLLEILKERYRAEHKPTIATRSTPVQYMVEQILKAKVTVCSKRKAKDDLTLEDLDL